MSHAHVMSSTLVYTASCLRAAAAFLAITQACMQKKSTTTRRKACNKSHVQPQQPHILLAAPEQECGQQFTALLDFPKASHKPAAQGLLVGVSKSSWSLILYRDC